VACANRPQSTTTNTSGVSLNEQINELSEQLREARTAFESYKAVTDVRLQTAEQRLAERKRVEDELRDQIADLTVKNAVFEERERMRERQSSRKFDASQIVFISLISAAVGALLPILIQLAIK
jgi:hypothetical protein